MNILSLTNKWLNLEDLPVSDTPGVEQIWPWVAEEGWDRMSKGLINDPKREATSSMRGYVYQAYQSVFAWMRLAEHEVLYLEGAEDFDVHEADKVTATQVKDTAASGTLTLRSPDVVEAINNFWGHKQRNPDKTITFRFLSTALPGQEKGVSFGSIGKGLEYWASVARDEQIAITPLREFLLDLPLHDPLKEFLRESDDITIRHQLIRGINWDTGSKPIDALVPSIKDQLVVHGDRKGVDSYHSEKVLDTLLRRVAELLTSKGERRLSYADFCRAFDEATLELMPRGEAAVLRGGFTSQLYLLSQAGTSPVLNDLMKAPPVLGEPLPLVRGAAQRERLVTDLAGVLRCHGAIILHGSTGLGKTSLARLLTDKIGGSWVWGGFRGRNPIQIADHLRRAAFEIKALGILPKLVLDDLDFGSMAKYEREFIVLVFSVINSGGTVIMTGPSQCPTDLLNKLWLSEKCDQEVPYLDEEDVTTIVINHGLEERQKLKQWSRVIWLTTQGHPQLVHARIRNLQSKGWPPVEELSWLQTTDLEEQRTSSRRRLMDEIPSENARSLAYRLSLMMERFPRQLALDLAQLLPPLPMPGEAFDCLVGPWIERVGEDSYRVSPLLQNEGNKVLSAPETKAVHEAIALRILGRKTVSPIEVGMAFIHALVGKSEGALIQLARGIIFSEPETLRAVGDVVSWIPTMALEPGQQLYRENPMVDLILRLAQYRITAACRQGEKALVIMDRTFELLDQAKDVRPDKMSSIMAYSAFLNTIEIPIPPRRSVDMLSRLMDLADDEKAFSEIVHNFKKMEKLGVPMAGLSPFQTLFSLEAARITGLDDLDELLSALEHLSPEKRTHLVYVFSYEDESIQVADLLIGTAWVRDASRDHLEVKKAITVLGRALELGRAWQVHALSRAAYVAMSVIYDEYGNASQAALDALDKADAELGADDARVLNQRAKVLLHLKENRKALPLFESALASSNLPKTDQTFACRSAGIAAARLGDWSAAERFFLLGASKYDQGGLLHGMSVGLKADAAFARWKQGRVGEALTLYAEVLKHLESIPFDKDLKSRHLHALVRHSIAWIHGADRRLTDREMVEPPPGACSNQEPHGGLKDLRISDISDIWGLLGNIDTKLGTGLGIAQLALEKAGGKLPLLIRIDERISKYEALWNSGDVGIAVPVIIGMIEVSNYRKEFEASTFAGWQIGDIPALPGGYWNDPSNRAYLLFHLLSVEILATSLNAQTPLPIEQWRGDLEIFGIHGEEVERFLTLLDGKEVVRDEEFLEQAAFALYKIREAVISPIDLFVCHFRLLNALVSGDWGYFVGNAFADLVSKQWLAVAEHQKFALRSPFFYVPILLSKCQQVDISGYAKAGSILETAADAVGAYVAQSGRDFLSRVRKGETLIKFVSEGHMDRT
jgi:tetratricopeptide (TPR) repeat protein